MIRSLGNLVVRRLVHKMAEAKKTRKISFRCATFNILAPCYNRLKGWWRTWESSQPNLYMKRYQAIVELIAEQPNLDAICLQEFWFNDDAMDFFERKLGEKYRIIKLKRQGEKTDGLAILIDRSARIIATQSLRFNDYGYRVALLLHLHLPDSDKEVILATTHLSYCHNLFDQYIRMSQAQKVVNGIDSYIQKNEISSIPVILTGDFNSPEGNPVYVYVSENGYESSFKNVHGKEAVVTHKDHTGQQLAVDYIFYKNSDAYKIEPKSSLLLPEEYNDVEWPEEFQISDHRMIVTEFELEAGD
ncbi:uncharacterized calcium-binding protein At1g02270-like [Actinia tenebrosa]|uniref:Uncharacterized calcium-binding protein At1g02270-like n=1 Tax=Actinia tenebrosa TaxID=6105 RepID=A0A6P8IDD4_ACTTE|nr:uncharacterized calcium-binding protein At1g02270-like [Actinia tenebrosa]